MPEKWRNYSFSSSSDLREWLKSIRMRIALLTQYVDNRTPVSVSTSASSIRSVLPSPDPVSSPMDPKPTSEYNMAAFMRPDHFIRSVMQDYARRYFKDVLSCRIQVEVNTFYNAALFFAKYSWKYRRCRTNFKLLLLSRYSKTTTMLL